MKTKYVLLLTALTIALTLLLFGQNKTDMKKHQKSSIMVKPIVDATVEGLHMKVWLMTQKQHKKMMNENMERMGMSKMKDTSMGMDKAMKEAMMAGTHHIMLSITDSTSGKEITDATVKVLIEYPSKKNSSFELKPVMNHLGRGLTLNEKGKYNFKVVVVAGGVPKEKQFKYTVK